MVKWVFSILQNTWKYSVYADNRKLDIKFSINLDKNRIYGYKLVALTSNTIDLLSNNHRGGAVAVLSAQFMENDVVNVLWSPV